MRCPLPPPPPIAFSRNRRPGCSASRRSASRRSVSPSSSIVKRSMRARYEASSSCSASSGSARAVSARPDTSSPCSFASAGERGAIGVLAQQRAHGGVVDARRDRHLVLDRGALGLVLRAGGHLRVRARADEREAGLLERAHEAGVLGHEAVAGEHGVVAVLLADADDVAAPAGRAPPSSRPCSRAPDGRSAGS